MTTSLSILELALVGQVLIWLFAVLLLVLTRQASLFHPLWVYFLFHGVVFVVRPLLVHYLSFDTEWKYMGFEPDDLQQVHTLAASSLALIVITVAALAFGWCDARFKSTAPRSYTTEERTALVVVTLILAPLILYSIKSFLTGGLQVEERNSMYVMVGASGYTIEAQFMAAPLICAWLALTRFRWPALIPVVPYIAYRAYCGTARSTFVLFFLVLVLVYAWQKRIKSIPGWAVCCAIPLFLVFSAVGENRQLLQDLLTGEDYRPKSSELAGLEKWKAKYDSPDFSNYDSVAFVLATVPERTGSYTYGSQYLQLFTEPIPRKLWPGKPAGAPVRSFNLNNYGNFFGLTVSIVGDGWISGGWIGLFITMALVGAALGWAHRWFWRHADSNVAPLFYLVGLAMSPQWFRDGGISIAKFLFWNLSPLGLWMAATWLVGRRNVRTHSELLPPNVRIRVVSSNTGILEQEANN